MAGKTLFEKSLDMLSGTYSGVGAFSSVSETFRSLISPFAPLL
jgi:hypothetical protein